MPLPLIPGGARSQRSPVPIRRCAATVKPRSGDEPGRLLSRDCVVLERRTSNAEDLHGRPPQLRARPGKGGGGAGGQAGRRRAGDHDLQPAPAAIPVGVRPLSHDEGEPLGARGRADAARRRAVALGQRALRDRPLDRPHGDRLLLGRRGDRGRQRHPRRPRAGHGERAQARARPPRARGEHPRRLAALHDLLAGHRPSAWRARSSTACSG
jgi:hypothetical protein